MIQITQEKIFSLVDLTLLKEDIDENDIKMLCQKACSPSGFAAAVCIYLQYIVKAKELLTHTPIKIATVINFPTGALETNIQKEIDFAKTMGADELDVVFPYSALMANQEKEVLDYLKAVRHYSENLTLKIILETGVLHSPELIKTASKMVINAGGDFIKTSTGKVPVGATLEAAQAILEVIADTKSKTGLKISGGIRTYEQIYAYLELIEKIMGPDFIDAQTLRIGTSGVFAVRSF